VKADSAEERNAYAHYLGGAVVHMLEENFRQMRGPAADAGAGAGEPAAE